MDFSEIFGFLIILKETLKILPKNGKLVASIAILSFLLPSILFSLFINFLQFIMANINNNNNNNHVPKYTALLLAVQFSFLIIYCVIFHLFSTATVVVSAFSYTGKNLNSKDLLSSIKRTWKKPFSRRSYSSSSSSSSSFLLLAVLLAVVLVFTYPNFITIFAAVIFGILVFIFQLYSSVVSALSVVVSIVEDSSRMEALEKAEKLVNRGQRLHGFMLNLFFYLVAVILILPGSYYYIDELSVNNVTICCGLFFFNFVSLLRILALMAYTVFYFRLRSTTVKKKKNKKKK
ncbi:hypothetical protein ACP275_10G122700 [Erythranthe tilingii]